MKRNQQLANGIHEQLLAVIPCLYFPYHTCSLAYFDRRWWGVNYGCCGLFSLALNPDVRIGGFGGFDWRCFDLHEWINAVDSTGSVVN